MNPVVTVCLGHRCAPLLCHHAPAAMVGLGAAVADSTSVILVSTGCVGTCAQAPVVVLSQGDRQGERLELRTNRWLGPVRDAEVDALCHWVRDGACTPLPDPLAVVVFST